MSLEVKKGIKGKKIEKMIQTQKGALDKFFKTGSSTEDSVDDLVNESQQQPSDQEENNNNELNEEVVNLMH